jgi:hypothetical protein
MLPFRIFNIFSLINRSHVTVVETRYTLHAEFIIKTWSESFKLRDGPVMTVNVASYVATLRQT